MQIHIEKEDLILKEVDKKIITELAKNPRNSIINTSRSINKTRITTAQHLKNLKDSNIFRLRTGINRKFLKFEYFLLKVILKRMIDAKKFGEIVKKCPRTLLSIYNQSYNQFFIIFFDETVEIDKKKFFSCRHFIHNIQANPNVFHCEIEPVNNIFYPNFIFINSDLEKIDGILPCNYHCSNCLLHRQNCFGCPSSYEYNSSLLKTTNEFTSDDKLITNELISNPRIPIVKISDKFKKSRKNTARNFQKLIENKKLCISIAMNKKYLHFVYFIVQIQINRLIDIKKFVNIFSKCPKILFLASISSPTDLFLILFDKDEKLPKNQIFPCLHLIHRLQADKRVLNIKIIPYCTLTFPEFVPIEKKVFSKCLDTTPCGANCQSCENYEIYCPSCPSIEKNGTNLFF